MDAATVLVCGSSEAGSTQLAFARELGRRIILATEYSLITGGLAGRESGTRGIDCAAASAAAEACQARKIDERQRIITMLPADDSSKLLRCEHGAVKRIALADTRSRRYAMVLASDAVITIGGGSGTQSIIDLAWIAEKPLIPLPSTGGASSTSWHRYGALLVDRLRLTEGEQATFETHTTGDVELASAVLAVLERNLRPRCFVAMPYSDHPLPQAWSMFSQVLEDRGFQAIRVDKERFVGRISDAIWSGIRTSSLVIADITGSNPNVFYELGIAHALAKPVVMTAYSGDGRIADPPFDVADHRVVSYRSAGELAGRIDDEIVAVRRRLGSGPSTPP